MLGKGSFGKVLLVKKRAGRDAGRLYALKTLRKEVLIKRNQIDHTKTERSVLQTVEHPFIVTLRYAWQTRDKLYLVTDYAPGGELFFWLKRDRVFSQSRVRLYAAELVLALEHLHDNDIVYRDLKPENILLDGDGHILLTDFGLSKEAVRGFGAEGGTSTFCGTPEYLAPEILENTGHGKAVDWWSLATLLYEMCAGLPPFYDEHIETMYEKIMTAELVFPRHFLPETRALLTRMLERDYRKRLGYNGAAEIKAHPFFAGLDWDAVREKRVEPMFRPPLPATETDTPNFEDEFTREVPEDSVPDHKGQLSSTQAERAHFEGFTFNGEAAAIARSGGSLAAEPPGRSGAPPVPRSPHA